MPREKLGVKEDHDFDVGPTPCDGCVNLDICATGQSCSTYRKWVYPKDLFISALSREPSLYEYSLVFGPTRRRGPKRKQMLSEMGSQT